MLVVIDEFNKINFTLSQDTYFPIFTPPPPTYKVSLCSLCMLGSLNQENNCLWNSPITTKVGEGTRTESEEGGFPIMIEMAPLLYRSNSTMVSGANNCVWLVCNWKETCGKRCS